MTVCRELLLFFQEVGIKMGGSVTVGQAAEVVESFQPAERKMLLRAVCKRAGLEDPEAIDARERMKIASRAAAIRQGKTWGQPVLLAFTPSGAIVDLDEIEADAERERARAASLAARRAAEQADQEVAVEQHRESQRARHEATQRELPPHLRGVIA